MSELDQDRAYDAFVAQARRCEGFASASPSAYRWRVAGLAALGYGFPPAVLAVLVAAFAAGIWFYATGDYAGGRVVLGKIGIALAFLIAMVVRAMWPSFGAPEGVRLRRGEAPELFAFIDEIRAKAGRPKVDRVYVVDDMNAAVRQTPRLGLLGWYRNDLILGLPLMQALTKPELAAVIAHEFGHLSGAHGKMGAWIYRSNRLMGRILGAIEEKRYFGSWIFAWFYRWYAPYFAAYSFALRREQEYEADAMAAAAVSQQGTVDALVRVSLAADYMDRSFWGEVWGNAVRQARPPEQVYGRLGTALSTLPDWEDAPDSFEANLAGSTDYADTHPALGDRARALGAAPRIPDAGEPAASLLPDGGAALVAAFSRQWQALVSESWDEQHQEVQEQKQQLAELDAAAERGALSENDALTRAFLAERFMDTQAALARFEQALAWNDDSAAARFAKGRLLLLLGKDEGLACLNQVMDQEDDAIVPGCQAAEVYLTAQGREAQAGAYGRRREAHEELLQEDWVDRRQVKPDDSFVVHQCTPEKVGDIVEAIAGFKKKGLKKAWLVRKLTRHRQNVAAYFLICEIGSLRRWTEDMDELQAELSEPLTDHEDLGVAVCDVHDTWLRDKAAAVQGAQVYPRK